LVIVDKVVSKDMLAPAKFDYLVFGIVLVLGLILAGVVLLVKFKKKVFSFVKESIGKLKIKEVNKIKEVKVEKKKIIKAEKAVEKKHLKVSKIAVLAFVTALLLGLTCYSLYYAFQNGMHNDLAGNVASIFESVKEKISIEPIKNDSFLANIKEKLSPMKDISFIPIISALVIIILVSAIKLKKDFPYTVKEMIHEFNYCLKRIDSNIELNNFAQVKKEYLRIVKIYERLNKSNKISLKNKEKIYAKIKEVNNVIKKRIK
jgi:hypothetical protein